jgi:hypothetical protein
LFDFVLHGLTDFVKQTKARETRFKQPQNGARLSPKLVSRSMRNKTKENHKQGEHLQIFLKRLASLGNEASERMGTLDMP